MFSINSFLQLCVSHPVVDALHDPLPVQRAESGWCDHLPVVFGEPGRLRLQLLAGLRSVDAARAEHPHRIPGQFWAAAEADRRLVRRDKMAVAGKNQDGAIMLYWIMPVVTKGLQQLMMFSRFKLRINYFLNFFKHIFISLVESRFVNYQMN